MTDVLRQYPVEFHLCHLQERDQLSARRWFIIPTAGVGIKMCRLTSAPFVELV
jgi:hypothetical protein